MKNGEKVWKEENIKINVSVGLGDRMNGRLSGH